MRVDLVASLIPKCTQNIGTAAVIENQDGDTGWVQEDRLMDLD